MTVTEDFITTEESNQSLAAPRSYPTLFGLKLTPEVIGLVLALLGLAGFIYLIVYQLIPAWQKQQELRSSLVQKQTEIQQKQATLAQSQKLKTELAQAKQQQTQVLSLFANEKTLNTLLLDLDRLVAQDNAQISGGGVKAKLTKYTPVAESAGGVISDSSLGPEVNGKLKSQVVNVGISGTFAQTQALMSDIERLQPLLIVKDYQSTLAEAPSSLGKPVVGPGKITTTFQLQALIPLSPQEVAKATADAAAKQPQK